MLWMMFQVAFILGGTSTALNENDWIDAIIEVYSKFTKYANHGNVGGSFQELFTNDAEELWPGEVLARRENMQQAEDQLLERYQMNKHYLAFAELLYSSSGVAVVRAVAYPEFVDGGQRKTNGLDLFVRSENGTKIKLTIFNFS